MRELRSVNEALGLHAGAICPANRCFAKPVSLAARDAELYVQSLTGGVTTAKVFHHALNLHGMPEQFVRHLPPIPD